MPKKEKPKVIRAAYADYKNIKTRKVVQFIFEIPQEMQSHAFQMLGYPSSDEETWVAIAPLENNEEYY